MTGLATLSGPFIGGAVAQGLPWPWIFWINIPIGPIVIAAVPGRMGESHGLNFRFEICGVLLATCGAPGLVWGLVRASSAGYGPLAAGLRLMPWTGSGPPVLERPYGQRVPARARCDGPGRQPG